MKGAFRSARGQCEDKTGLDFFGPVRAERPLPVAAVIVPATLVAAIAVVGLTGLDFLLRGALTEIALQVLTLGARWGFIAAGGLALGLGLAALATRRRRA